MSKLETCPRCGGTEKMWMERSIDGKSRCRCGFEALHTAWRIDDGPAESELRDKMAHTIKAAIDCWGERPQVIKTCEEAAELITVLCKSLNGSPVTPEQIIDEIADALFMVSQMRVIFGSGAVDARLDYKLQRTLDAVIRFKASRKGETAERQNQGERNET